MILRRLRVHPFGRFADREVSFGPGLTVVLGPNEAGKSTLWYSLRTVLLRPAKLSSVKFQENVRRFVPVDGGDVVRATVEFEAGGDTYVLARHWGSSPGSELRQPRGGPLTDEKAVQDRMAELLPSSPETVAAVLMVRQSELGDSLITLGAKGALDDVSAVLRRVVQQTGGVSVEQVRRRLVETADALYGRWDRERGAPEKNRGIENPWKNDVGEVLAAWYAAERLRADLDGARAYERDLDTLNRGIEDAEAELRGHEAFLEDNAAASRDAAGRRTLEAELALEAEVRVRLMRDADEWPVREAREKDLAGLIADAEALRPKLAAEQQAAEAEQTSVALRAQAARVGARKARLASAEAALAAAPELARSALAEIQAAAREADRQRAAAEALRLSVSLSARGATSAELRADGGAATRVELGAGESRTLDAGSSFSLRLPDLDIAVARAASRGDPGEAARRLASLLAARGLADAAEAEVRCRRREELAADRDRARRDLNDELAGEPLEAFEARAAALGPVRETRPVGEVARELARAEAALAAGKKEQRECRARLEDLAAAHGARERLLAALGASVHRSEGLAGKIAACAPLPAGFADAAVFLAEYERRKAARERAKDAVNGLLRERAGREAVAPEQTGDELEEQLGEARGRFAATLARAKAVDRVVAAVERLATSDDDVYTGLAEEVARRFAGLSLGEHPGVLVSRGLPSAVKTATGANLPWQWLSAGAMDLLGLAVRLAMAGVVIGPSGGFLVMDDPLVDLDPERQAAAAAAIREFAAGRQTIVFTCHPAHAELLGGELVRLA